MDQVKQMFTLERSALNVAEDALRIFREAGLQMIDQNAHGDGGGTEVSCHILNQGYEFTFTYAFQILPRSEPVPICTVSPKIRLCLYDRVVMEDVFILEYLPREAKDRWLVEVGLQAEDLSKLNGFFQTAARKVGDNRFMFHEHLSILAMHVVELFSS